MAGERIGRVLCADRAVGELPWLRGALAELGCAVEVADHAEAVLDRVAALRPELVLLGGELPGMSGLEVCRRLTAEPATAGVPVLLIAPRADDRLHAEALAAGALAVLGPGGTRPLLVARLASALAWRRRFAAVEQRLDSLRDVAARRDSMVSLTLNDCDTMLDTADRALSVLDVDSAGLSFEQRRYVRVARGEVRAAESAVRTLQAVRAIEAGEWELRPAACDLGAVLDQVVAQITAESGAEPALTASCDAGLELVADARLLAHGLASLVVHVAARAGVAASLSMVGMARPAGGAAVQVGANARLRTVDATLEPVATALQFTLARMVAEFHGGRIETAEDRLTFLLPAEPPRGAPPSSQVSRGEPGAAGPGSAAAPEAAALLAARAGLPAPPRPPRLMPPAAGS